MLQSLSYNLLKPMRFFKFQSINSNAKDDITEKENGMHDGLQDGCDDIGMREVLIPKYVPEYQQVNYGDYHDYSLGKEDH